MAKKQVDFSLNYTSFVRNLMRFEKEDDAEKEKVLKQSAAIFAAAAQRYTPPQIGSARLPEKKWYGISRPKGSLEKNSGGKRQIIDLLPYVRNKKNSYYKTQFGYMLREGFRYAVMIQRNRKKEFVFCRDAAEAAQHAYITYRGLYRSLWGSGVGSIGIAPAPAIRELTSRRPRLTRFADRNKWTFRKVKTETSDTMELTVSTPMEQMATNRNFIAVAKKNAEYASTKFIGILLSKYFRERRNRKA